MSQLAEKHARALDPFATRLAFHTVGHRFCVFVLAAVQCSCLWQQRAACTGTKRSWLARYSCIVEEALNLERMIQS